MSSNIYNTLLLQDHRLVKVDLKMEVVQLMLPGSVLVVMKVTLISRSRTVGHLQHAGPNKPLYSLLRSVVTVTPTGGYGWTAVATPWVLLW